MNDPTHWELASTFKLPGVVTTMHLDPRQVPTRTKRAAQRMIASGCPVGGWQSKSRKLATLLSNNFGLGMSDDSGPFVTLGATDDMELRRKIAELAVADHIAHKLQYGGPLHASWGARAAGYQRRLLHSTDAVSLYLEDLKIAEQCRKLIADNVTDALKERRKEVAAMLDGFELIPITNFTE